MTWSCNGNAGATPLIVSNTSAKCANLDKQSTYTTAQMLPIESLGRASRRYCGSQRHERLQLFHEHGCASQRKKTQHTAALLSTDAEPMSLLKATQEAVWLGLFLCELRKQDDDEHHDEGLNYAVQDFRVLQARILTSNFVRIKFKDNQVVLKFNSCC